VLFRSLFNYKTDTDLVNNLTGKDQALQQLMEEKLKAIVQTYNSRLIDNNMVVRKEK
jgi:hypothetical protein